MAVLLFVGLWFELEQRGTVAQLVECWTRCSISMGLIPRCDKRLFPLESTGSADLCTVFVQPQCAVACTSICVHVKNPTLAVILLWGLRNTVHTVGMGSAALAAAV